MRIQAKRNLQYGGRNYKAGDTFEVSEVDGSVIIEKGFAEPVEVKKPKKPKKKNASKSVED
ncbi:hypothetical protein CMI37_06200 [Candidatus Pacearchaeota archaeon]|nr:hypothetical protein [Candidatus Pacearchaeota archaeon]|tara:strand:- start:2369 stop:2551 length:183 start_codon:yes stop_codon:yes gene_type:complete